MKTSKAFEKDLAKFSAAWEVANAAEVLPLLADDDLTVRRFMEVNPGMKEALARNTLNRLVEAKKLVTVRCRQPGGGGPVIAYRKSEGK